LYERVDAVVVHTRHGADRLIELGLDPQRVHVIPHGVLRPWEHARVGGSTPVGAATRQLAAELPAELRDAQGPVVLFFGLWRPYKGIDLLLHAWRGIEGAQLWIVGMPRMDTAPLIARAPAGVRFLPRFVSDPELGALMRRASLVVLPYREIDQSGVAFSALGAGAPLLLSNVGGFPEIAATGAARTFRAGDTRELHAALARLLADPPALGEMAAAARAAAAANGGPFSWDAIARAHLALYERLLE